MDRTCGYTIGVTLHDRRRFWVIMAAFLASMTVSCLILGMPSLIANGFLIAGAGGFATGWITRGGD
jgi:hypothetical protein